MVTTGLGVLTGMRSRVYKSDNDRVRIFSEKIDTDVITVVLSMETLRRRLSKRELECLQLKCQGFQLKEIAEQLGIKTHTVRNYITFVYDKLDVRNPIVLCQALQLAKERENESSQSIQVVGGRSCSTCID